MISSRMRKVLVFCAVHFPALFFFSCQRPLQDASKHEKVLRHGWLICPSSAVQESGNRVSSADIDLTGWYPASVPTTVLAALVKNGVYREPYFGKNLEAIPAEKFKSSWWYRKEFTIDKKKPLSYVRLFLDGINYSADLWLNGKKIASSDTLRGAFRTFNLDITAFLEEEKNILAVEVYPPQPGDFTIGFVDWNPKPPDDNTGIWREVRIRQHGPVSINDPFVRSQVNGEILEEAALTITAELVNHSGQHVSGIVKGKIEEAHFTQKYSMKPHQHQTLRFSPDEYPELNLQKARLWWPNNLGRQNLYPLKLSVWAGGQKSDEQTLTFGIREVSDYFNPEGHRGYKINGKKVLVRGAGWVDDLLLASDPEKIEAQIRYARHMNLNALRLEGFWGSTQKLYDLADRYGILLMAGWSCHWEWEERLGKPCDEFGGIKSQEDIELMVKSFRDQVIWLRNHPSILVWALGSDMLPRPELEKKYRDNLEKIDPTRPVLAAASYRESAISGPTGVKMNGPYDYVTPNYWYLDTTNGGAFGFNTETGPGPQPPPLESLKKMIPEDHLWPIDDYWEYHCARKEFRKLDRYEKALNHRYGKSTDVAEFLQKAQLANYEAMRAMFEAFGANKPRATGIIQWMFNSAWPGMYWQLFDYFLMPNGAFYGAKKGNAPLHILYNYGDHGVYVSNDTHTPVKGLKAEARILNIQGKEIYQKSKNVTAGAYSSLRIFLLPEIKEPVQVYFVDLRLCTTHGERISQNFYWLSAKKDVLDENGTTWYYTPNKEFADFTSLKEMPDAKINVTYRFEHLDLEHKVHVRLENPSPHIAFFIHMNIVGKQSGQSVLPIFWEDNYVSLLPGESREIWGLFLKEYLNGEEPELQVNGWNVIKQ